MAGIMFEDVVSPRARSNRKWYTLPLSFLVHTSMLALLIVVPLIARTNGVQGVVIIEALIGADGLVEQAHVLRSHRCSTMPRLPPSGHGNTRPHC